MKNTVSLGAAVAAVGVILGAFGAHAIKDKIEPHLFEIYTTGVQYLMLHAFALIFYGLSPAKAKWPPICFLIGIFIFTGSLFAITFTGIRAFGAITPIGGLLFIAGWIGFALQTRNQESQGS
jgi:uncharacterized membrane protein YgdD (TMEM256/DUF423 family)